MTMEKEDPPKEIPSIELDIEAFEDGIFPPHIKSTCPIHDEWYFEKVEESFDGKKAKYECAHYSHYPGRRGPTNGRSRKLTDR